jgi:TolB-like protein
MLSVGEFGIAHLARAQGYDQQVRNICVTVGDKLSSANKKTVAVVDFTDLDGTVTWLGRFLAEELSVGLASQARGTEVIERTQLKAILQEHKLSTSGVIDPQTARQLGQFAGAEALITGSLTPFGDSIRMSVKVLDTNTARMITAATADIPKTKAIEELLAKDVGGTSVAQRPSTADAVQTADRPTSSALPATPARLKSTVEGVRIELVGCKRSGTSVACRLLVTNETERSVAFQLSSQGYSGARTRAFDSEGNEFVGQEFYLGAGRPDPWNSRITVLPAVPVRGGFTFRGVGEGVSLFVGLEIVAAVDPPGDLKSIQFRNVAVE